jgi:hypothetical protein
MNGRASSIKGVVGDFMKKHGRAGKTASSNRTVRLPAMAFPQSLQ